MWGAIPPQGAFIVKTYKNLYPELITFENLYLAYRQARKGKRSKAPVADFELNYEPNLLNLQEELRSLTYKPGAYHNFTIYEPKQRLVSAAPFRDRVVHHALCRVIEPIWEARFHYHSYACRVGKGTHAALDQAHQWVRRYPYVFHGDIVKYFPSIDHQILMGLITKKIRDPKVIWLAKTILDTGRGIQLQEQPILFFPGDDLFSVLRPKGLPIGNLTSQFWANVFLHELVTFVTQELHCHAYLRYMDDFLLFSDSKVELNAWKKVIRDFLGEHLRLWMNENKSVVIPTRMGLDFCGFVLFPEKRKLRRTGITRFLKRFKMQRRLYADGEISLEEMSTSVQSWIAHAKHADSYHLRSKIFREHPFLVT